MEEKKSSKWQPGQSGNPAGRPAGRRNIIRAKDVREMIGRWVNDKALPDLFANFESMSDRNKIELVTKLMPYFTPTLSASKNENIDGTESKIRFQIVYQDTSDESDNNIDDADFEQLPPTPDGDFDF